MKEMKENKDMQESPSLSTADKSPATRLPYEAPHCEAVGMETEGPILNASGRNSPWGGGTW